MIFRFQFRRYTLPFRAVVNTAHGPWRERTGVIVRLEDEAGRVGWGEAAPIPWFGTETVEEIVAAAVKLGARFDESSLADLPARLGCLRHALAEAGAEIGELRTENGDRSSEVGNDGGPRTEDGGRGVEVGEAGAGERADYLAVAALLPAGRVVLAAIAPKAEAGFRVFKWKVGVDAWREELALFDDVCAALPEGGKLRLDANGAWDRRVAERWLERCADRPVEFVEQPIAPGARGAEDGLRGLAEDYPTALALDESLANDGDVERWIGAGWRGVYVVKPALCADVGATLRRLAAAQADVVFSSALETAVGARAGLRRALRWPGKRRAVGYGVWPLFADACCDGPAAAAFVRVEDVERIDPEAVWNALG